MPTLRRDRRHTRRQEAVARQEAYDKLSLDEKIKLARKRGGTRELSKLLAKK